ncbi:MAG: alkaline phosphatase D family protein [Pseudonocardia sp.]
MSLLLGPVLRHVGETTASVWVQVDRPATVEVLGCTARTFEVSGHHYALVPVTGLAPGSRTPYEVHVDGTRAWPPPVSPFPPSAIRTRGGSHETTRLIFGSCRYPKVADPAHAAKLGIDALDAYAARMAGLPEQEWPDALLLLGDQVYADELTPQNRRRIAGRRDRHPDWPDDEIVGFDEYVGLYRDSWSDPEVRWLMSTVPTAMIFDDHDVRDDWNTSAAWRAEMNASPWWRERIRSGLISYWVYQHIGNLPPDELAADPDHRRVIEHAGDTWPLLVELADRADAETDGAKGVRFSFRWDLGTTRLIMIDSRNGRILDGGAHLMLGDSEFRWIEEQAEADGHVEHLVLGTSLPWLLPHAIGDVQAVNEVAAARPGWRGRLGEAIRQAADLEHWAAFDESFERLTRMIGRAAAGSSATVSVLSGDVHHGYVARADLPGDPPAHVHQLTCSPVHQHVDWFLRPGFKLGWSRTMARLTRAWSRRAGVPPPSVTWERVAGPLFGNLIATLDLRGREATAVFEQPRTAAVLDELVRLPLTAARPAMEVR